MEPAQKFDFAALLEQAPALIEACIADNIPALRNLRLVSKEASRVALLGLRSYTLSLRGQITDSNIDGAPLLQQTRLSHLNVQVYVVGGY